MEDAEPGPAAAARLVAAAVAQDGVTPGAVLAVGRGPEGPVHTYLFGTTSSAPDASLVTRHTRYDLASLTKVVATTPIVLRLADAGELALDDPVGRYLPPYTQGRKAQVTIRHLLTHTSGLPAERKVHLMPGTTGERFAALVGEPLVAEPGTVVCYSDIGFILLGAIIQTVTHTGLARAARELVFDPLGMPASDYLPVGSSMPSDLSGFAATEPGPDKPEPKVAVVHDENAEALGGVAGHAGLFATADDLVRYVRLGWLARESPILSAAGRAAALACHTDRLTTGRRGLGWTLAGDRWDHMTAAWPRGRAGHTGFTGTSIALDPAGGLWCVLLTNAVHHGRDHSGIALLRRTVHAAVAAWSETTGPCTV